MEQNQLASLDGTIEGFYSLLKERTGIEKRAFIEIDQHIIDNSGHGALDEINHYISEHIVDAAPGKVRSGRYNVLVPFDCSRFTDKFFQRFDVSPSGWGVGGRGYIDYNKGSLKGPVASSVQMDLTLIDENGRRVGISDETLVQRDPKIVSVQVGAGEIICLFSFKECYEYSMKDFRDLVGILTGSIEGKIGYHGRNTLPTLKKGLDGKPYPASTRR